MSLQNVKNYFAQFGMEDRIKEFDTSSATVELAAAALGCAPERIAKSLTFTRGDGCIMLVTAGDTRIDNPKFKAEFGMKAKMLSPAEVDALVGHSVGGVCPFAIHNEVEVFLDISLKRFETVFPACGSSNSAIELTIEELERYSEYVKWVDVCKEAVKY